MPAHNEHVKHIGEAAETLTNVIWRYLDQRKEDVGLMLSKNHTSCLRQALTNWMKTANYQSMVPPKAITADVAAKVVSFLEAKQPVFQHAMTEKPALAVDVVLLGIVSLYSRCCSAK
jgi:hypothetical protein